MRLRLKAESAQFEFIEPGVLSDGELELVEPHERWVDDLLAAVADPLTRQLDPEESMTTREGIMGFLHRSPLGRRQPGPGDNQPPAQHFWMHLRPECAPPLAIAGSISLRIASTEDIELYMGNLGYHVYPAARGRHLAARACRLLLPLAGAYGLRTLWITTNPDNLPSRKTCLALGARLVDVVSLPEGHPLYVRGDRRKCRYRLELPCCA